MSELIPRRELTNPAERWSPTTPVLVSPRVRISYAITIIVAFLVGWLGIAAGLSHVGPVAMALFLQFAPGVAFCLVARPAERSMFALLSVALGPALVVVTAMFAVTTGAVSLTTAWRVLAVLVLLVAVLSLVRDVRAARQSARAVPARALVVEQPDDDGGAVRPLSWTRSIGYRPALPAVAGLVLAVVAAGLHRGDPTRYGAALTAGPVWFIGAVLMIGAVALAWRSHSSLAVPVLAVAALVPVTQAVMYAEPTVVVAARHIGLVDYIQTFGKLDLSTDIYQGWSGLFSASALIAEAAQIQQLFTFAAWWGVIAAPIMVAAVRMVAARFLDYRRSWLAALVFGLGNSLNTVFFAPQVFGFILSMVLVGLLTVRPGNDLALSRTVRLSAAAIISVALAVSHQISPYMVTFALVALVLFGLVRPRWVWLLPLVPAVGWAIFNRHLLGRYVSSSSFGQLFSNLAPPEHSSGTFPEPLANSATFLVPAAALVVIGLVALGVLLITHDRTSWGLAFGAASSVVIMMGTSYGNEGIFRVALFALPWLAILGCLPITGRKLPGGLRVPRSLVAGLVLLLFAVSILGQTGMDWARVIRPSDVAVTEHVERTSPKGTVIMTVGTDLTLPYSSTAQYKNVSWISRDNLVDPPDLPYPTTTGAGYGATADLDQLTDRFVEVGGPEHLAVVSESIGAYDERYGNQWYADHQKIAAAIDGSPRWELVYRVDDAKVYRLREPAG